jgi:hypothetical protein
MWPIQLAFRFLISSNLHELLGSFSCRKAGTWDRFFYFPSAGRHAEDFFTFVKIQRLRPGLNPRPWVPEASMLSTRPPKPSSIGLTAPQWDTASLFTRFLDHTQRHTTVGRIPLDEWSTRRRILWQHTKLTEKNIYAPSRIRTHNPSKGATTDLLFRPRGSGGGGGGGCRLFPKSYFFIIVYYLFQTS